MKFKTYIITENDSNRRIDRVIKKFLKDLPLSGIYSVLRKGKIKINGKKAKHNSILQTNDKLQIAESLLETGVNSSKTEKKRTSRIGTKQNNNLTYSDKNLKTDLNIQDLEIITKNQHFLIVNKPENTIVHGANSLNTYIQKKYTTTIDSLSFRPGPLHRLDKNTTGILVFSQSLRGAQTFSKILQNNTIKRHYIGITIGNPKNDKWITTNQNRQKCITTVKLIHPLKNGTSLVEFILHTGRKHQIRQQCQKFGYPLLADTEFGGGKAKHAYLLHCYKLYIDQPILTLPSEIIAPLQNRFKQYLINYLPTDLLSSALFEHSPHKPYNNELSQLILKLWS